MFIQAKFYRYIMRFSNNHICNLHFNVFKDRLIQRQCIPAVEQQYKQLFLSSTYYQSELPKTKKQCYICLPFKTIVVFINQCICQVYKQAQQNQVFLKVLHKILMTTTLMMMIKNVVTIATTIPHYYFLQKYSLI